MFQRYNLIPHQSVLQNVEIVLTCSGVSKAERRKRAIARALVNNPDIILAGEPNGAKKDLVVALRTE